MDLRVQALIAMHPEEFEPLAERWWATFFPQNAEQMRLALSPNEVWTDIADLLTAYKVRGFGLANGIRYHEHETMEARQTLTAWFRQYGESRGYGESRALPRIT